MCGFDTENTFDTFDVGSNASNVRFYVTWVHTTT